MDALSQLISHMRTGVAKACRVGQSGTWAWRFPPMSGIGFHIVERGSGWLLREGEPPRTVSAGDVVLLPQRAEHGLADRPVSLPDLPEFPIWRKPIASGEFQWLAGCYQVAHPAGLPLLRDLPPVIITRSEAFQPVVSLLAEEVADERPGSEATRTALVDLLIVNLLRWADTLQPEPLRAGLRLEPGIAAAVRAVQEAPYVSWNIQELSVIAGMSRTRFIRRFGELVGKPPMAYVTSWRLARAAHLLRQDRSPLSAIARQVGYGNEFSLASAFRRQYGVSPGHFRLEKEAENSQLMGTRAHASRP
jgi:AraC-like DNA-binding protein